MRKFINLLLILIIVITSTLIVPSKVQAANKSQMYWKVYRNRLWGFLKNWRTNAPGTCIRIPKVKPDGVTTDCLSEKRIHDILAQLDQDGYFRTQQPVARQNYLRQAQRYSVEMRKIVMWFEKNPTAENPGAPYTIVYGASDDPQYYYDVGDMMLDGLHAVAGFAAPSRGDNLLLTLATDRTRVRDIDYFVLRDKQYIKRTNLEQIYYKTSRMAPFSKYINLLNWTEAEKAALAPVVDIGNKAFKYMVENQTSPTYARDRVYGIQGAWQAVGAAGAVAIGGINFPRGTLVAVDLPLVGQTLTIGSVGITLEEAMLRDTFQASQMASKPATMMKALTNIKTSADYLIADLRGRYPEVDNLIPQFIQEGKIRFVSGTKMPADTRFGHWRIDGQYIHGSERDFSGSRIEIADNLSPEEMQEVIYHELLHYLRDYRTLAYYYGENFPYLDESVADFITRKGFRSYGIEYQPGYPTQNWIYGVAGRISRKQGISFVAGQREIEEIYTSKGYAWLDDLVGYRTNFATDLDTIMGEWYSLRRQYLAGSKNLEIIKAMDAKSKQAMKLISGD